MRTVEIEGLSKKEIEAAKLVGKLVVFVVMEDNTTGYEGYCFKSVFSNREAALEFCQKDDSFVIVEAILK